MPTSNLAVYDAINIDIQNKINDLLLFFAINNAKNPQDRLTINY